MRLTDIRLIWIFFLVSCCTRKDNIDSFDYLREVNFWSFLDADSRGFALVPAEISGKDESKKLFMEVSAIREKLVKNEINDARLKKTLFKLARDNPVGYVYFCIALSDTNHGQEYLVTCRELLGDDSKKNFLILYGLYAHLDSARHTSGTFKSGVEELVDKVEGHIPVISPKQFPDIYKSLRQQLSSEISKNPFP